MAALEAADEKGMADPSYQTHQQENTPMIMSIQRESYMVLSEEIAVDMQNL